MEKTFSGFHVTVRQSASNAFTIEFGHPVVDESLRIPAHPTATAFLSGDEIAVQWTGVVPDHFPEKSLADFDAEVRRRVNVAREGE